MLPHRQVSDLRAPKGPQVISITGAKGGTGKTTVAVNLASALVADGRRVLLLDGDLGLANVDVLLGIAPRCTLEQVLSGERTLEEIIVRSRDGVSVIPAASGVSRMAGLAPAQHAAIIQAFAALPGNHDVLIVDTAAGITDSVLSFCQAAQQQLVVLRDEPASLTDAYALIKVLRRERDVRAFKVLVNMSAGTDAQGLFQRLQRVTDRYLDVLLEYAGGIPWDDCVPRAVRAQRTVLEAYPGGSAARAFRALARTVQRWPAAEGPAGHMAFFFERMLARPAVALRAVK
jgi:flagellar biosynthesis protein FlhG